MADYFLTGGKIENGDDGETPVIGSTSPGSMADLKVFWGPEICRLEYLIHLLDTGRIKAEQPLSAGLPPR